MNDKGMIVFELSVELTGWWTYCSKFLKITC